MNAEILAVGTELLLGDIVNTNAQYLSRQLAGLGIGVYYQTVVGDNESRLQDAYRIAFGRSDIVVTTGGLGPTEDDLTKEVAAKYFHKTMVLDDLSLANIKDYFTKNQFIMTEENKKQAYIPECARALPNYNGTAPGVLFEENDKMLIMLPGPPNECIPMFEEFVLPVLRERTDQVFISRMLCVCGIGESALESMLKDLIDGQDNPSIAPYAKLGEVRLRLTASAMSEDKANNLLEPLAAEIYRRLGNNIYGEGETTLEDAVGAALIERELTIACAESCTGGMLTARLVNYPGISKVLKESVVTYTNESKTTRLGVGEKTLQNFGAVSAECAMEMASGIAYTTGADIGLSITGIAGPDGGTDEKPVGLVYIGLSFNDKVKVKELRLTGNRQRIRERTVTMALDLLRREIQGG